jgi:flagellar biosynthesis/type III secretory pathway protein FliH
LIVLIALLFILAALIFKVHGDSGEAGYQRGWKDGHQNGNRSGLLEGDSAGHVRGFREGHTVGWGKGYYAGDRDALEHVSERFTKMIQDIEDEDDEDEG